MQDSIDSELKVAEFLLKIKAVRLSPKEPFTWASGIKSPIYCDNRRILSYPSVRNHVRKAFTDLIQDKFPKPEVIAGVATGGIAIGALVAQDLGLPFVYVRSSAKKHGMQNMIEGVVEEGQNVIVVEDLISTGMSSLKAVDALREAKANVKGLVAIFSYGFEHAQQNFENAKCPYYTLSNYENLLTQALADHYITEEQEATLREWRENPENWNNG